MKNIQGYGYSKYPDNHYTFCECNKYSHVLHVYIYNVCFQKKKKNLMKYLLTPTSMAIIRKRIIVGEYMEKKEPLHIGGGNVNWCSSYKVIWRFSKKITNGIVIWFNNLTMNVYPKKLEPRYQRELCTVLFIADLFTIVSYRNNISVHWCTNR